MYEKIIRNEKGSFNRKSFFQSLLSESYQYELNLKKQN